MMMMMMRRRIGQLGGRYTSTACYTQQWVSEGVICGETDRLIHRFNGHRPCKRGLAVCPLDSQSPVIPIQIILTGQANSFVPT